MLCQQPDGDFSPFNGCNNHLPPLKIRTDLIPGLVPFAPEPASRCESPCSSSNEHASPVCRQSSSPSSLRIRLSPIQLGKRTLPLVDNDDDVSKRQVKPPRTARRVSFSEQIAEVYEYVVEDPVADEDEDVSDAELTPLSFGGCAEGGAASDTVRM